MIARFALQVPEGRTPGSSLFVFCAALLLLAGSLLAGDGYRWGAIALLAVAATLQGRALPKNLPALCVVLFCAWYFVDAAWLTPNYTSEGMYRPLILLASFACFATMDRDATLRMFRFGVVLLALLAVLGLLQYFFGFWHLEHNPARSAATFVTPNTFATAIDLFLLPLSALYLVRGGSRPVFFLTLLLFAGLVSTGSRGGMLGLLAGILFLAAGLGASRLWDARTALYKLLFGWALAWGALVALSVLLTVLAAEGEAHALTYAWTSGSSERLQIYSMALDIALRAPFAGAGANMFVPLFQAIKPWSMHDRIFPLVHNDYLQVWLELGAVGALLLLAIVVTALVAAGRSARRQPDGAIALACGAALAASFAHAIVDFPLYVPFVLLVVGGYLGAIASVQGETARMAALWQPAHERLARLSTPLIKWVALFAVLLWVGQPTFASIAGHVGLAALREARTADALYWHAVARRLEPKNGTHYWTEGVVWRDQASLSGNAALMGRADQLFKEGMTVSPYDPKNFLERARLHILHRTLLPEPANATEVLSWTASALAVDPYWVPSQIAHARALAFSGKRDEARRMVDTMVVRYPNLRSVKDLAAEL